MRVVLRVDSMGALRAMSFDIENGGRTPRAIVHELGSARLA
jgi:hypothetical protein